MRYLIFTFLVLLTFAVLADYYLSLSIRGFRTGLPQEQAIKYPIVKPTIGGPEVATTSTSTFLDPSGQKKFLGPTVKPFIIGPKSPPPGAE